MHRERGMHDARPRQKWLKRHFGWWFALAVMVPLWLCASGQVTQAYAAGPPPMALLYGWQPLVPHVGASRQRAELRPLAASYKKKRWAKLCNASERLRQRLLHRAAKLFYRPVRQGADTRAIERFLERYVRGASPLLITAGEVFAPAPALRDLAVHGCVRAGKPHLAERFVAQVAIAGKESRLRVALALIRLQKGEPASKPAPREWLAAGFKLLLGVGILWGLTPVAGKFYWNHAYHSGSSLSS